MFGGGRRLLPFRIGPAHSSMMDTSGAPFPEPSSSSSLDHSAARADQPVLRFAPSPNGYLHVGHAYSALANERAARKLGGRLLLRMENIDPERCRPEFETAITEDLAWLGVDFEPEPRRQAEHFAAYQSALRELHNRGLIYPCFCTRAEISRAVVGRRNWPRDPDGSSHYPGTCRGLTAVERTRRAASLPAAMRIDMARALATIDRDLIWREFHEGETGRMVVAAPEQWGDAVLARRDIPASYHIAVVVDDHLQGVTDVVRGLDLYEATSLHRLVQELLGYRAPNYRHHDILRDEGGDKLSKRNRAKSIRSLRAQGVSARDLRRQLGFSEF